LVNIIAIVLAVVCAGLIFLIVKAQKSFSATTLAIFNATHHYLNDKNLKAQALNKAYEVLSLVNTDADYQVEMQELTQKIGHLHQELQNHLMTGKHPREVEDIFKSYALNIKVRDNVEYIYRSEVQSSDTVH
tara:strand:+ start:177 stop:572 length:396 start_codon:yes stop_codon:yes gene_type:complete